MNKIDFKQSYNKGEFLRFIERDFLPEDFRLENENIQYGAIYTKKVTRLGICPSLELDVIEVIHTSTHDARVGLSKEAFRLLLTHSNLNRALILFVSQDNPSVYRFSLVSIDVILDDNKLRRSYSNPRRYSFVLGREAKVHTPSEYLIHKGRVRDWDDLQKRFSVEVLTKEFYAELSDWYSWAISEVQFPNEPEESSKEQRIENNSKSVIRLLTRLLFVWFLKQKHLIPSVFFDEKYIADNLLKDFYPNKCEGIFLHKSLDSKFYKAILQNLFFATLNCPITPQSKDDTRERGFRKNSSYGQHRDANYLMRYENLFKKPAHFLELTNNTVPFLNGGLFDCLDNKSAQPPQYVDGFSDNLKSPRKLIVPDYLFFGEEKGKSIDLTWFYGDKKKKSINVRGLIDILNTYNFTIEENTPYDQEVSLDPELLGKVFENLLASYNPETKTTARKQTGSFYTPREIVQYMVDESLIAHLKHTVGEELESEYRKLMQYTDESPNLNPSQKEAIIKSLFNCKIIDPACGSGAFPVGILQQMVHILAQLDPENKQWEDILTSEAIQETSVAYKELSPEDRKNAVSEIENNFDNNMNRPDYARKLYLIENCIYGVDIQPIAVQISKLRFFISLVVEQNAIKDASQNFGIRPLPNLEAKFVAANTLIGLDKEESLWNTTEVCKEQENLKRIRHKIFSARQPETKRKLKIEDQEGRIRIAELLKVGGFVRGNSANVMSMWDPYDQNESAPFFDPEWMFGVSEGFDIVIGNPPYGVSIKGAFRKLIGEYLGKVPDYEIYYYFIQIGGILLCDKGILSYIIPNTYLFNTFADKYRISLLSDWNIIEILDCSKFPIFESATVLNTVNTWQKSVSETIGYRNTKDVSNFSDLISKERLNLKKSDLLSMNQNWGLAFNLDSETINIIKKIKNNRIYLCKYFPEISQGLIAYDKYQGQTEDIISKRIFHHKIYKIGLKKWLWGGDISRYNVLWNNQEYIDYCEGIANRRQPKFFKGQRILVREITNPSIYCAITEEEFYNDPSLIIILGNELYSLFVVLGILNSQLATFFHFNHAPKATKGAFPKILVKDIKEFPLPIINNEENNRIEDLVKEILLKKQASPDADTSALETQIDQLVYELYGLTDEEIRIIENK